MTCIFLNPVVEQMYDRERLYNFLTERGFQPVFSRENWGAIVLGKYQKAAAQTPGAIADVRCPRVARRIRCLDQQGRFNLPDVEPILFHCAREISARPELKRKRKLIITPCRILAEEGNDLGLLETEFLTWNDFLKRLGANFPGRKLGESPIPPGFFREMEKTDSVTGEEAIEEYLKGEKWRGRKIVEMLWCSGGCHNGDGVMLE